MLKRIFGAVLILLSGVSAAFAVTPIACSSLSDPNPPDYIAGYFIATDTNPATQVYSMSQAIMVDDTDAGFVVWQAVQNNCVNTYPTLVSLYAAVNSQAKSNFPNQPTYFSATSAVNVTLTNPLGVAQIVMSTSGKSVILPNMGLYNSPPIGKSFRIINAGLTNSFNILDSGSATVVATLLPQTYADITTTTFGGPNTSASWTETVAFGVGGTTGSLIALPVGMGGTGATTFSTNTLLAGNGTSAIGTFGGNGGGIPYVSGSGLSSSVAASAVLAANQLMLGGGAGGSGPTTLGSLGTTTTVLHGNAAGNPSFGAVSLTADVANTLPAGNGGTGVTTVAGEQGRLSIGLLGVCVAGVNFNSVADTAIVIPTLPTGYTRALTFRITITNASHSLTTATYGVFTAVTGGGTPLVNTGTAITVSATADATANNAMLTNMNSVTLIPANLSPASTIQFRVTNAEGAASTGDVCFEYVPVL